MRQAQRRTRDERGVTLVIVALTLVGLIAVSGLAIDGGNAYAQSRQVQNAADAASLSATHKLFDELYAAADASDPPGTILATAQASATSNTTTLAAADCFIVGEPTVSGGKPPVLGACPASGSGTEVAVLPSGAAGVKVLPRTTTKTSFMQVVGISLFNNVGTAAALIETPSLGTGTSPVMLCAVGSTDASHNGGNGIQAGAEDFGTYANADRQEGPPILVPSGGAEVLNTGPSVYPADSPSYPNGATDQWYRLRGSGNKNPPNCGLGNGSSYKGVVDQSGSYSMPGYWTEDHHNGGNTINKQLLSVAGQTSGSCATLGGGDPNCIGLVAVPLCYNTGAGGTGQLFCLEYGVFLVFAGQPSSANIGEFLGTAGVTPIVTGGSGTGQLPPSGSIAVINLAQ